MCAAYLSPVGAERGQEEGWARDRDRSSILMALPRPVIPFEAAEIRVVGLLLVQEPDDVANAAAVPGGLHEPHVGGVERAAEFFTSGLGFAPPALARSRSTTATRSACDGDPFGPRGPHGLPETEHGPDDQGRCDDPPVVAARPCAAGPTSRSDTRPTAGTPRPARRPGSARRRPRGRWPSRSAACGPSPGLHHDPVELAPHQRRQLRRLGLPRCAATVGSVSPERARAACSASAAPPP